MTDKRIKMDCPFCHTKPEQIQVKMVSKLSNFVIVECPNCGCSFSGKGKQNLIDKWNRR